MTCDECTTATAQGSNFNVEEAIECFLADPDTSSFELPFLTTGQRKQARKMAEQHPELSCVSYGISADRRLHLFKRDSLRAEVASTNRSTPDSTPAPAAELPEACQIVQEASVEEAAAEESRSQAARKSSSRSTSACSSPSSIPELPVEPQHYQMRNTFIHFDNMQEDQRVARSMPDGMFRQCLMDDLEQERSASPGSHMGVTTEAAEVDSLVAAAYEASLPSVAAVYEIGGEDVQFRPSAGAEVLIEGLTKCPAFNGLGAVVQEFDEETGRYTVLITSPSCWCQKAKLKLENLRPFASQNFSLPPR